MWTPSDIFGPDLADQYITLPSLKQTADQTVKPVWAYNGDDLAYQADRAVISAKTRNKEAALKFVDAFYSPDMTVQSRFGAFGTAVEKLGENSYKVLDPPENSFTPADWMFHGSLADGAPGWVSDDIKLETPAAHNEVGPVDAVYDNDYKNVDFNKDVLYANMPMTSEQTRQMNANNTGITQGAMSKFAQWVTKGGVENEWDDYVANLKRNKLDDNIRIEQEVYDSFRKNMDSIGVNLNN